ncbi:MAG TPA: 23S rRNA (cytidine(2498)-2'-O)-methyltransferase RlmM [Usitatibacter sp.]|nr:23S rRNA (cytidine(2498)-2'-O)-methyltransferase RlmM [Usitatibacter sp.]
MSSASRLLLYCRAGFERECAQEATAIAAEMGCEGFVRARPDSAFALFSAHDEAMGEDLARHVELRRLVFARQLVRAGELITLTEADRVAPIVAAARGLGKRFAELFLEMPDTNDGKALASLTRPLRPHLEKALRKAGIDFADAAAEERLHVFFVGGLACHVGVSEVSASSPWPMGIPRLRMPSGAPSRSTLKLAEALQEFLDPKSLERRLAPETTAVDLGASPGGWTWQLVRRGVSVIAVDNGEIDAALLDSGLVKHRRTDGLTYRPSDPVDWMVCDIVESPSRVARLAARWIAEGWCRESIFNLKLPMKKRWEEVLRCRGIIDEALGGSGYYLRMKQLYHDREEITGYLARRKKGSDPFFHGEEKGV